MSGKTFLRYANVHPVPWVMSVLIAGPPATGKPEPFSRLISADNSCTSQGMSDEAAILAANAAYYRAFTTPDFAAMSRIWAEDNVSCIHPGWPVLIGRPAILESYREIMRNPEQERIDPRNETVMVAGDEARVICVEFVGGAALAATNLFKRVDGTWRMTHHQASPIAALVEEAVSQPSSRRLN
jgi:ketosteroid isomerase-like protein